MSGRKNQVRSGKILCFTEENFVKRGATALVKKEVRAILTKTSVKACFIKGSVPDMGRWGKNINSFKDWMYKHSEMNVVSITQKTLGKSVGSVFKCYYSDIDKMVAWIIFLFLQ